MNVPTPASEVQPATEAPASLAALLRDRINENATARYIEVDHGGQRTSATVPELDRKSAAILQKLQGCAPANQSDIVLCFERVLDFVPAAWACILGGFSFLPWHVRRLGSASDLASRLDVLDRTLYSPVLVTTQEIPAKHPTLRGLFKDTIVVDEGDEGRFSAHNLAACRGDVLLLTSGTTGTQKVAVLGHESLLSRYTSRRPQKRGQNRIVCFPFESVTGLWTIFPGAADMVFIQPERLAAKPLEFLNVIEECRIEAFSLSTSMAARIYEAAIEAPRSYDVSSLARVGFGSEMIDAGAVLKFVRHLQEMGAHQLRTSFGYGMTETGPLCWTGLMTLEQLTNHIGGDLGPVGLGRVAAGWQLRIVDDAGRTLPDGVPGNVEVWSQTKLFSGYRRDEELTRASFTNDGWFKTGDVGISSAGTLTLTGRQKSTIIVNARSVGLESIETQARKLDGIYGTLVAAASTRTRGSTTEELAVFFVARDDCVVDALCRDLKREIARCTGISVKHFIPVAAADFPLTATNKVRRDVLVERFRSGALTAYKISEPAGQQDDLSAADQSFLAELWQRVLRLERNPARDENFFDLGGDSLASAELIFAVEEHFSRELPLDLFFECPTIDRMEALLRDNPEGGVPKTPADSSQRVDDILNNLRVHSASWSGERLFSDSLLIGFNTDGKSPPIFWVLQEYFEALALADYLGPDQPLYVMRSCVGIAAKYTTSLLETVGNRYLWEILSIQPTGPILLFGTCQGAILALALARRLQRIGREPCLLGLMEWSFSYGRYYGPTLLMYGRDSFTAETYQCPNQSNVMWGSDFPNHIVQPIAGAHGNLFSKENIVELCAAVRDKTALSIADLSAARSRGFDPVGREVIALKAEKALILGKNEALKSRIESLQAERKELERLRKIVQVELEEVYKSTSWRLTQPIRTLKKATRRFGREDN